MDFTEILSQINSSELQTKLLPFKIVLGGAGIFLLAMLVFLITQASWHRYILFDFREFFMFRPFGFRKLGSRWQRILARLATANEAEYKLAILEADNILEETLKRMNIPGQTIADRLNQVTPAIIPNIESLQDAHKIRNNIVYDPDYRLTLEETRKTIEAYETAFRGLDLI